MMDFETRNEMGGPLNSSVSKFVAGSFRPEKSDLIAPSNDYWAKN